MIGAHVKKIGLKSLCARGKVEVVHSLAIGEQSSCNDVKQWALDYVG